MNIQTTADTNPKTVKVDFLYLDESVCIPCGSTAESLAQAIDIAAPALSAMGLSLELEKIHISSPDIAIAQKLMTSPTIRVNGIDIDPQITEDDCPTCSTLANDNGTRPKPASKIKSDTAYDTPTVTEQDQEEGCCPSCDEPSDGPSVLCRTWHWQDQVYKAAPIGKIVEAIVLASVSTKANANSCCTVTDDEADYVFPDNLKTFFAAEKVGESVCCGAG